MRREVRAPIFVTLVTLLLALVSCQGKWLTGQAGDGAAGQGGQEWSIEVLAKSMAATEKGSASVARISILHPYAAAVLPADLAAPIIEWRDEEQRTKQWLVAIKPADLPVQYHLTRETSWTPAREIWEPIKSRSLGRTVQIRIAGLAVDGRGMPKIVSRGSVNIRISRDKVEAPILYRQVPPVFRYAQQHPEKMKLRLGQVSSYQEPTIVMEKQRICFSCHHASADGKKLGMDMDFRKDRGAYLLTRVQRSITLRGSDFISWDDFPRLDARASTGLFSRIAPKGDHVVSTVNEISLLVRVENPNCSQLFLPLRGILAQYSVVEGVFRPLPGADDRKFVQTSPEWSPDGRYILFARTAGNDPLIKQLGQKTTIDAGKETLGELNSRYPVQFEIYRLPFNAGKGGVAVPLVGASGNGMSNYYPRYSPDGRWIIFTRSRTGLVVQPDAQLYILPAQGGKARRMICNPGATTSWHSWSPNGRWLVFISKAHTPVSELYIAHVDENGQDAPPVRLHRLSDSELAANVPEFINIQPDKLLSVKLDEPE